MKLLKGKIVLLVLGLALGGAATFGAIQVFGESLPFGQKAPPAHAKVEPPKVGMMYPMKERIVNLADPGVLRYLKTTVVLEITSHSSAPLPKGEEYKKKQDELVKDLRGVAPIIEDQITGVLSSKTTAELMTPEGKQKLKDEIKAKLNKTLEKEKEEVLAVYFSDFIIQ